MPTPPSNNKTSSQLTSSPPRTQTRSRVLSLTVLGVAVLGLGGWFVANLFLPGMELRGDRRPERMQQDNVTVLQQNLVDIVPQNIPEERRTSGIEIRDKSVQLNVWDSPLLTSSPSSFNTQSGSQLHDDGEDFSTCEGTVTAASARLHTAPLDRNAIDYPNAIADELAISAEIAYNIDEEIDEEDRPQYRHRPLTGNASTLLSIVFLDEQGRLIPEADLPKMKPVWSIDRPDILLVSGMQDTPASAEIVPLQPGEATISVSACGMQIWRTIVVPPFPDFEIPYDDGDDPDDPEDDVTRPVRLNDVSQFNPSTISGAFDVEIDERIAEDLQHAVEEGFEEMDADITLKFGTATKLPPLEIQVCTSLDGGTSWTWCDVIYEDAIRVLGTQIIEGSFLLPANWQSNQTADPRMRITMGLSGVNVDSGLDTTLSPPQRFDVRPDGSRNAQLTEQQENEVGDPENPFYFDLTSLAPFRDAGRDYFAFDGTVPWHDPGGNTRVETSRPYIAVPLRGNFGTSSIVYASPSGNAEVDQRLADSTVVSFPSGFPENCRDIDAQGRCNSRTDLFDLTQLNDDDTPYRNKRDGHSVRVTSINEDLCERAFMVAASNRLQSNSPADEYGRHLPCELISPLHYEDEKQPSSVTTLASVVLLSELARENDDDTWVEAETEVALSAAYVLPEVRASITDIALTVAIPQSASDIAEEQEEDAAIVCEELPELCEDGDPIDELTPEDIEELACALDPLCDAGADGESDDDVFGPDDAIDVICLINPDACPRDGGSGVGDNPDDIDPDIRRIVCDSRPDLCRGLGLPNQPGLPGSPFDDGDNALVSEITYRGADRVIIRFEDPRTEDIADDPLTFGYMTGFDELDPTSDAYETAEIYEDEEGMYAVLTDLKGGGFDEDDSDGFEDGRVTYLYNVQTEDKTSDVHSMQTLNRRQHILYTYGWIFGDVYSPGFADEISDESTYNAIRGGGPAFHYNPPEGEPLSLPGITYAILNDTYQKELDVRLLFSSNDSEEITEHLCRIVHDRLYENNLDWTCDPTGVSYWAGLLDNGALSLNGVKFAMLNSSEYQSRVLSAASSDSAQANADLAYQYVLRRGADAEGRHNLSLQGETLNDLRRLLTRSEEYEERLMTIDSERGREVAVNELYETIFGRPADPHGLRYWTETYQDRPILELRDLFLQGE